LAVNEGHVDIVTLLIQRKANIDAKTKMGRTPLHIAVLRGVTGIVKVLSEYGADINCEDDTRATPLHYGAEHGHCDIVEYLLEKKANAGKKNKYGQTPCDLATVVDIIRLFEKRGFIKNPDLPDYSRTKTSSAIIPQKQDPSTRSVQLQKNEVPAKMNARYGSPPEMRLILLAQ
jgi:GA-binding protein transcription factor beta